MFRCKNRFSYVKNNSLVARQILHEVAESATAFWALLSDESLDQAGFVDAEDRDKTCARLLRTRFTVILKSSQDIDSKSDALFSIAEKMPTSFPSRLVEELQSVMTVAAAGKYDELEIQKAVDKLSNKEILEFADVLSAWASGQAHVASAVKVVQSKAGID